MDHFSEFYNFCDERILNVLRGLDFAIFCNTEIDSSAIHNIIPIYCFERKLKGA